MSINFLQVPLLIDQVATRPPTVGMAASLTS
jgi:hypothetical protein